jgi:hypothetical protein
MAAPAPEDPAHRAKSVADELPLLVAHGISAAATEGERALAAAERLESLDVHDIARGVAGGSWSERTSPTGYYRGAGHHGTLQPLINPMGRAMKGK